MVREGEPQRRKRLEIGNLVSMERYQMLNDAAGLDLFHDIGRERMYQDASGDGRTRRDVGRKMAKGRVVGGLKGTEWVGRGSMMSKKTGLIEICGGIELCRNTKGSKVLRTRRKGKRRYRGRVFMG